MTLQGNESVAGQPGELYFLSGDGFPPDEIVSRQTGSRFDGIYTYVSCVF